MERERETKCSSACGRETAAVCQDGDETARSLLRLRASERQEVNNGELELHRKKGEKIQPQQQDMY